MVRLACVRIEAVDQQERADQHQQDQRQGPAGQAGRHHDRPYRPVRRLVPSRRRSRRLAPAEDERSFDRPVRSRQQVAIAKLPLTQVQEGRRRTLVEYRGVSARCAISAANAVVTPPVTATWVISMGSIRMVMPR